MSARELLATLAMVCCLTGCACRAGHAHQWGKWSAPVTRYWASSTDQWSDEIQERICVRCGAVQRRKVQP